MRRRHSRRMSRQLPTCLGNEARNASAIFVLAIDGRLALAPIWRISKVGGARTMKIRKTTNASSGGAPRRKRRQIRILVWWLVTSAAVVADTHDEG